jgi:hypothetical protein
VTKYTTIFLFLSIFLISCTKEIKISVPSESEKIALIGYVHPSDVVNYVSFLITAKISETTSIFDTTFNKNVSGAHLFFISDSRTDSLTYSDTTRYYYYNDYFNKVSIADKQVVKLDVEKNGQNIVVQDTMPSKIGLESYNIIKYAGRTNDDDLYSEITLTFKDPLEETNYYEIRLSQDYDESNEKNLYQIFSHDPIITTEPYYPSIIDIGVKPPPSLLFSDKAFNGKKISINFDYLPSVNSDKNKIISHVIFLQFRSISESYYKFMTSYYLNVNNQKVQVFTGNKEPINVFTNVPNGCGIFAAYQMDRRTILIQGDTK